MRLQETKTCQDKSESPWLTFGPQLPPPLKKDGEANEVQQEEWSLFQPAWQVLFAFLVLFLAPGGSCPDKFLSMGVLCVCVCVCVCVCMYVYPKTNKLFCVES